MFKNPDNFEIGKGKFDLSNHDCKTCKKFDKCQVKDLVDFFKDDKEKERVITFCEEKFKGMLESPPFLLSITTEPAQAILLLMALSYIAGRKDTAVAQLEKLNSKGANEND